MKVIAKTDEYTIFQKRSERYAVKNAAKRWINGDEKVAILLEHKLIEAAPVKAPEPEVVEEAAEEAAAEASAEASAEETEASAEAAPEDEQKSDD